MFYNFDSDQIATLQRNRKTFNKLLKSENIPEISLEQYIHLFIYTAIAEDLKARLVAEAQIQTAKNFQANVKAIDAVLGKAEIGGLQ